MKTFNLFINRESIISHKYRMSGISIDYKTHLKLAHKEQIILESRIMNMSPANYLRYLQSKGARLYKVYDSYITYYFLDSSQLDAHLSFLNKQAIKFLTKAE